MSRKVMPLDQQVGQFEKRWEDAYDDLYRILDEYRRPLHVLARERLVDGFGPYKDAAFRWPPEERLRNLLEELADAIVYRTSGDV